MSASPQPTPTLIIRGLPPKALVGIDLLSFTCGPNFCGIKDLVPGAHFLYTGTTESFSLRSGEWFYIGEGGSAGSQQLIHHNEIDIRLRKWDNSLEAVIPIDESRDDGRLEAMQQRANLGRIWASGGLLAYQSRLEETARSEIKAVEDDNQQTQRDHLPRRSDWSKLTSYITPPVLNRILGRSNIGADQRWIITSGSSAPRDVDHIPGLSASDVANATGIASEREKEMSFLPVDLKKTWREGAIGRERTEAAQDRSWALGDLIDHAAPATEASDFSRDTTGEEQVLGELQFTFLMVLTLMNFSSLEQWKRLLGLVLTCRSAIKEREAFFVKVLQLLRLQLGHCDDVEGGLFEMNGDGGGAFLKNLLVRFRRSVDDTNPSGQSVIIKELTRLETFVKVEYGWELSMGSIVRRGLVELEDGEQVELELSGAEEEDETGEYAPVVVDTEAGEPNHLGEDVEMRESPP